MTVGALMALGCYAPDLTKTNYLCDVNAPQCPDGLRCINGCCGGGTCGVPISDAGTDSRPVCGQSLSQIGTADFTIAFRVATRATMPSTMLYQRQSCDGTRDLWDVQLSSGGALRIALLQSGGAYTDLTTTVAVNNGQSYDVVLKRTGQVLRTTTSGVSSGAASAPQNFGYLPPMGMLSGDPCEVTGIKPFVGTITNVCVTSP